MFCSLSQCLDLPCHSMNTIPPLPLLSLEDIYVIMAQGLSMALPYACGHEALNPQFSVLLGIF